MNKIGIIGFGNVGLAIVHEICVLNLAVELVIIDHNKQKASANISDFDHMLSNVKIKFGEYNDISNCDVVIIAAGVKQNSNRTGFLQDSYQMISKIMDNINKVLFSGIIIVVSNPNDVLTTYVSKNYGFQDKVIGTGCMLDINRLKSLLGRRDINGVIIGEHGRCQRVIWDTFDNSIKDKKKLEERVITAADSIVDGKGYTNYGISSCVSNLLVKIFSNRKFKLVASFYNMHDGIAYSYPLVYENKRFRIDNEFNYDGDKNVFINKIKGEYRIFENKMIIGVDLDDTITDIQSEMKKYAAIFDQENNGHGIVDSNKYLVGEMYGWNKGMLDKFFLTYRSKIVLNAKVRRGTIKNFKKWRKNGYRIIIITARNKEYYNDPYNDTYKWLKRHHVPFDELVIEAGNKKDICERLNVNYFIDDMPNNCNLVSEMLDVKVFIMSNGNNYCNNKNITRVNTFDDISEVILDV